jgi:protein-L-isoaspartate O-methyltransferase
VKAAKLDADALRAAAELKVADHLSAGPKSVEELAAAVSRAPRLAGLEPTNLVTVVGRSPYLLYPCALEGRAIAMGRALCHARSVGWRIDPEGVETRALRELAPVEELRVLELGCGDGRLTFRYASDAASVLAVDPDAERIEKARAALKPELAGKITFMVAGAAEVDAPRESFDLALFSSSL